MELGLVVVRAEIALLWVPEAGRVKALLSRVTPILLLLLASMLATVTDGVVSNVSCFGISVLSGTFPDDAKVGFSDWGMTFMSVLDVASASEDVLSTDATLVSVSVGSSGLFDVGFTIPVSFSLIQGSFSLTTNSNGEDVDGEDVDGDKAEATDEDADPIDDFLAFGLLLGVLDN